ncbi:hypothetical protein PM082_008296 [Marasmius tenuissimus]|nr:hypothetical protein PM082_008296 [Marasmius tenuissimus]
MHSDSDNFDIAKRFATAQTFRSCRSFPPHHHHLTYFYVFQSAGSPLDNQLASDRQYYNHGVVGDEKLGDLGSRVTGGGILGIRHTEMDESMKIALKDGQAVRRQSRPQANGGD